MTPAKCTEYTPRLRQLHTYAILNKLKTNIRSNIFLTRRIVLCENEGEREEGGGRILLGDHTGSRAIMLRPIRFQSTEFQLDALVCVCIVDHMRDQPRLALNLSESDYCVILGVSVKQRYRHS